MLGRPQNGTITLKTAGAAWETDKGAFGNGPCPSWVFRNQGRYDFPVPCFAMLDVKHGMQIEVAPLAIAQADAAQPFCNHRGSPWRRPFDTAQGPDRLPNISAPGRHFPPGRTVKPPCRAR